MLQLLLTLVILHVCVCIEQTKVAYFSFSGVTAPSAGGGSTGNFTRYDQLMKTDDSPFQLLKLPWTFNFLGTNTDEVYISANGAVHLNGKQPCPPLNYFATDQCTFDTSYYSVIAGYLNDLDPSKSTNGEISSISTNKAITVTFENISYFNSSLSNSFHIALHRDSHIELTYVRIKQSLYLPQRKFWASGLRGAASNQYAHFTAAQRQLATTSWETTVPSVYPAKTDVRSGNTFTICPVSRAWCMQPSTLSLNASQNADGNLTLSTLLLSCVDVVEYGILISRTPTMQSAKSIPCATIGSSASLSCNVTLLLALNFTAGSVYVAPAWKTERSGNAGAFAQLPVDAMVLNLVESIGQTSNAGCANNLGNSTCGEESCALCSGNLTCLDLPCAETGNSVSVDSFGSSTIFDRTNCNSTCSNAIPGLENYYLDASPAPKCCGEGNIDCSGYCGGPGVTALNTDDSVYCCADASKVDCAGICEGTARRDACGTCKGTDTTGLGCFSTDQITVSTGYDDGALHPVFDVSVNTTAGLQRNVTFNVTNSSPFPISASLKKISADDDKRAPDLTIPASAVAIGVNATHTFEISASIESLYWGNTTQQWATKSVVVQYFRPIYPSAVYTMNVEVYLGAVNCASVASSDTCIRLPACIYCLTSADMRILREEPAQPAPNSSLQQRRLFMEMVPHGVSTVSDDDLLGVCGDGWTNADCANIAPDAFVSGAARTTSHLTRSWIAVAVIVYSVLGMFML